jgi:hypothetical protein
MATQLEQMIAGSEKARAATPIGQAEAEAAAARKRQEEYLAALQAQMEGRGPSAALAQQREALDEAARNQAGAIFSARGLSPGLQAKLAADVGSQMQLRGAQQAAQIRAQEQQAAAAQMGATVGQARQLAQSQMQYQQARQDAEEERRRKEEAAKAEERAAIARGIGGAIGGGIGTAIGGPAGGAIGSSVGGGAGQVASSYMAYGGAVAPWMAADGGQVPMDHPSRDTVPAMLSPGEVVLPRSVALAPDAEDQAAQFVAALRGSLPKRQVTWADVVRSRGGR